MQKKFDQQLGVDGSAIVADMMSGNYENLLKVFDREFGSFVVLER